VPAVGGKGKAGRMAALSGAMLSTAGGEKKRGASLSSARIVIEKKKKKKAFSTRKKGGKRLYARLAMRREGGSLSALLEWKEKGVRRGRSISRLESCEGKGKRGIVLYIS